MRAARDAVTIDHAERILERFRPRVMLLSLMAAQPDSTPPVAAAIAIAVQSATGNG